MARQATKQRTSAAEGREHTAMRPVGAIGVEGWSRSTTNLGLQPLMDVIIFRRSDRDHPGR